VVIPANDYAPVKHFREMDWAWQHVAGDVDKYLVIMPAPRGRGRGDDEDCKYDTNARLEVWAGEMHLSIPALNVEGDGYLSVDLGKHPNLGEVLVVVSGRSLNTRDAYQFSAQWTAARHYTPLECAVRLGAERRFYAVRRVPPGEPQIFFDPVRQGAPQEAVLTFWDSRAYEPLVINNGPGLDAIFSSPRDQTLIVRLYDGDGILLGEGVPPGGSSVDPSAGIRNNLTPQSHLRVEGLTPGMFYFLQLVLTTDAGASGRPRSGRIALSPAVQ
jgi:hypothetical protein